MTIKLSSPLRTKILSLSVSETLLKPFFILLHKFVKLSFAGSIIFRKVNYIVQKCDKYFFTDRSWVSEDLMVNNLNAHNFQNNIIEYAGTQKAKASFWDFPRQGIQNISFKIGFTDLFSLRSFQVFLKPSEIAVEKPKITLKSVIFIISILILLLHFLFLDNLLHASDLNHRGLVFLIEVVRDIQLFLQGELHTLRVGAWIQAEFLNVIWVGGDLVLLSAILLKADGFLYNILCNRILYFLDLDCGELKQA